MLTFVKSRNAKDSEDYETWIEGGVSRTLNVFENQNDERATVIVVGVDMYNLVEVGGVTDNHISQARQRTYSLCSD